MRKKINLREMISFPVREMNPFPVRKMKSFPLLEMNPFPLLEMNPFPVKLCNFASRGPILEIFTFLKMALKFVGSFSYGQRAQHEKESS